MENIYYMEDRLLLKTYIKRRIAIVNGKGSEVYDEKGRRFIDLTSAYGVALLGHSNPVIVEAIVNQLKKISSCHGSFYNDARAEFLNEISYFTSRFFSKMLLVNSGAESVDLALKTAFKKTGRSKIIAANRSFHGKTLAPLSITWNPDYKKGLEHIIWNRVVFSEYGNEEDLKNKVDSDTAAIILEPVQGEGGVRIPPEGYLKAAREIASDNGALLILDEIQSGMRRTGPFFAFEKERVIPDVTMLAKGVAGGIPIGVTFFTEEVSTVEEAGFHTSTYGGNPLACAAGAATIKLLRESVTEKEVEERSRAFSKRLEELKGLRIIRELRIRGLMIGIELRVRAKPIVDILTEKGVLVLTAGPTVVRLLPALNIPLSLVDEACSIIIEVMRSYESKLGSSATTG
ncbi:MAG: aspartate aminotransferase family protein [Crenarchaeota archaeon]|nr:aspartate aminotransferase family protein [Thermoproteota archaeon]MDW8033612.1 aspartate aminotransferase family protein [Nitrososphaerota archaeon]